MGPPICKELRLDFVWERVNACGRDSVTDFEHLVWTGKKAFN